MKTFFSRYKKIFLLVFILIVVNLFFYFDLFSYLTIENLKEYHSLYSSYYEENPVLVIVLFFLLYVGITSFSLPGAAVMTLTAGALFGVFRGVIIVSFASSIGATFAMLLSRFFFRDYVEKRFGKVIKKVNKGLEKEGIFYLLSLRLVPVIPYIVVNLVFGLTKVRARVFYVVSQIGMILGTIVYVSAGAELARIDNLMSVLSLRLFLLFSSLAIVVLCVRYLLKWYRMKFYSE